MNAPVPPTIEELQERLDKLLEKGGAVAATSTMATAAIIATVHKQQQGLDTNTCADISLKAMLLYRQVVALELLKGLAEATQKRKMPVETLIYEYHARILSHYNRTSSEFDNLLEMLK